MTRDGIAAEVASRLNITHLDARRVIDSAFDVIGESIVATRRVQLNGFGAFIVRRRNRFVSRNPRRPQEEVEIPTHNCVRFKPSAEMKLALIRKPLVAG